MKPLIVFADAQAAAAEALRSALAARREPYTAGVTVGTRVPGDRTPETPHLPYVMVRKDTDLPHGSLADASCTLRVTVWHTDADQAHDLAQLSQGLLVNHSGAVIRGVRPATGPLAAVDDASGLDLSTFTVLAHVRPATA
ncbi:hypothetical protein [Streptomyces abikoensis]|uniref:hypothetical protein n=1 Tax=Streptomyces abikoensis TaxID=97398 RepID=UPI0016775E38|nr:hypothetical protein [Streptomyces abikoensis]GGP56050.1 hypothetical protein GCM10010214_31580 [Streptomyces abikoensis]